MFLVTSSVVYRLSSCPSLRTESSLSFPTTPASSQTLSTGPTNHHQTVKKRFGVQFGSVPPTLQSVAVGGVVGVPGWLGEVSSHFFAACSCRCNSFSGTSIGRSPGTQCAHALHESSSSPPQSSPGTSPVHRPHRISSTSPPQPPAAPCQCRPRCNSRQGDQVGLHCPVLFTY